MDAEVSSAAQNNTTEALRNRFPEHVRFRHPWRPYQERVLTELSDHLKDERLHIVAPPGSGKTVLGLEVVRRIGCPALVLAPTVAIKNQWLERFDDLFLPPNSSSLSTSDPLEPALLTALTYQELHVKMQTRQPNAPDVVAIFIAAGIQTVVLDEAHHLRKSWWESLTLLVSCIERAHVVSLTATPPLDVAQKEWCRYIELCGPIDTEISVPELVKERNLAPHQDLLLVAVPLQREARQIRNYRDAINRLVFEFPDEHPEVLYAISQHPWVIDPMAHAEEILASAAYFSSMLVFLKHWQWGIPAASRQLLGADEQALPPLTVQWAETLWHHVLLHDRERYCFIEAEASLKLLEKTLRRMGAIERRRTNLASPKTVSKTLLQSAGKLASIATIVKLEWASIRTQLRMVILADHIRAEVLPSFIDDVRPLDVLGVIPIFERLRREYMIDLPLGVLTGSMVIVPDAARADLEIAVALEGHATGSISFEPLPHDPHYVSVTVIGSLHKKLVGWMTTLLQDGHIKALVGTSALLGEGWDAPSVNTLVLASEVGSYVLSTQMRGRAIRIDPTWAQKVSNIWHLVCLEPGQDDGGQDVGVITRRFNASVGVFPDGKRIGSGIERLGLHRALSKPEQADSINRAMARLATRRTEMGSLWAEALDTSHIGRSMVTELRVPRAMSDPRLVRLVKRRQITPLIASAVVVSTAVVAGAFAAWTGVALMGGVAVMVALWKHRRLRDLLHTARVGVVEKLIHALAEILLQSLLEVGVLQSAPNATIEVVSDEHERVTCTLRGAHRQDASVFIEALEELLSGVDNPRYLVAGKAVPGGDMTDRLYCPVPSILGQKKSQAEVFRHQFASQMGTAELIYTRSPDGRRELLRARLQRLAYHCEEEITRTTAWI